MPGSVLGDSDLLEEKTDKNVCFHEAYMFDL